MDNLNEWFMNPEKDHQMILNTEKRISFKEGVAQAKQEDAINMIKENITLDIISKCTGLSLEELEKLKNDLS